GKVLTQLVVWGAGTGDGHGLCVAGAMGQAHLGRKYRTILAHYFPGGEVKGAPDEPPPGKSIGKATGGVTEKEKLRARAKRAGRIRQQQRERASRKAGAPAGVKASTAPATPPESEPASEEAAEGTEGQ
ncbi:MAG: hypothetical protein HY925_07230, partial [Elusimicrobia bacterium]|nr:hypothetical protein [Elusimicrobiota bacterium]